MKQNKAIIQRYLHTLLIATLALVLLNCKHSSGEDPAPPTPPPVVPPPTPAVNEVDFWLTRQDETVKLQQQTGILAFGTTTNQYPNIEVDEATTYQTVDG